MHANMFRLKVYPRDLDLCSRCLFTSCCLRYIEACFQYYGMDVCFSALAKSYDCIAAVEMIVLYALQCYVR